MAIQYPVYRNTLTKSDLGIPDYAEALNKGLNLMQNTYKSIYTPRNLENEAVEKEYANKIKEPYANNALRAFKADIGGKELNLRKLLFDMALKKKQGEQQEFLNNLISGGNASIPSQDNNFNTDLSGNMPSSGAGRINKPGHMTPHGFEGSLTGYPAEDYYANTGPDRQAEQEAVNRIDRANADENIAPISMLPKAPNLNQAINQGLQNTQVHPTALSSMSPMERINYIYEHYPQYAKALNSMGYKYNKTEANKALADYRASQQRLKSWEDLTPETKAHLVAIGQGAGIRGDQIRNEIVSGKTMDDILYDHGVDPENPPEPVYELTRANQRALNEREYASREVKYLSNFIKNATGQYANKIKGYNIAQMKDALFGKNDDQQARYLAARALSPELINLRLVLGGAKSTVSAIHSMADKSMLNSKIFESLVSSKVWKRAQDIADQELMNAFKASKKGYGEVRRKNTTEEPDITNAYQNNAFTREPTKEEAKAELARRSKLRRQ